MSEIKEAIWAEGPRDADGDSRFWQIGNPIWHDRKRGPVVTRITVQEDLPGLHCNLRRVCVWVGDTMVAEAPLHGLIAVGYALPEGGAA